jgi:hypothetical protein
VDSQLSTMPSKTLLDGMIDWHCFYGIYIKIDQILVFEVLQGSLFSAAVTVVATH